MSFSSQVKEELCRMPVERKCCAVAEAYGILLYCHTFSNNEARVITGNRALQERLPRLFRKAFSAEPDSITELKNDKTAFVWDSPEKMKSILETIGYSQDRGFALHLNFGLLEEEHCRASFLRGTFLSGGSVIDPNKRYHLELVTSHFNVKKELFSILLDMGFEPKEAERSSQYVTYFKRSEQIEDFLTTVGAPVSAMELMSTKVEKDLRNSMNRRVNCDFANTDKTVEAAQSQLEAIRKIQRVHGEGFLGDKLRETALLRKEYPEATLSELADMLSVSKSCLNHRMRKILEIAAKIE